jgi:hypothetical protein
MGSFQQAIVITLLSFAIELNLLQRKLAHYLIHSLVSPVALLGIGWKNSRFFG